MRTIKFRVWDTLREKFIENRVGEYVSIAMGYGFSSLCIDSNELVLQQYTGLIDKNGKEIYEGDILRASRDNIFSRRKTEPIYDHGEIKWHHSYWAMNNYKIFIYEDATLEVLGNIFENPELLK